MYVREYIYLIFTENFIVRVFFSLKFVVVLGVLGEGDYVIIVVIFFVFWRGKLSLGIFEYFYF